MEKFEIDNFLDDDNSGVYSEFFVFEEKIQAKIIKRVEEFEKKSISDLFKKDELEKIRISNIKMIELKLRITPPVRMLGVLERNKYRPFHIFIKKTKKISQRDINLAIKRIKIYYK